MFQFVPFKTSQVSVASTANGTQLTAANSSRSGIQITNLSSTDIYVGEQATGLTTSNGHLLLGTKGASISFSTTSAVYAIASTGSATVSILETL